MFNRTADLLDRIDTQLQSSAERLAASTESRRFTNVYLSTSRRAIDNSRRLFVNLRVRSGELADKQDS